MPEPRLPLPRLPARCPRCDGPSARQGFRWEDCRLCQRQQAGETVDRSDVVRQVLTRLLAMSPSTLTPEQQRWIRDVLPTRTTPFTPQELARLKAPVLTWIGTFRLGLRKVLEHQFP